MADSDDDFLDEVPTLPPIEAPRDHDRQPPLDLDQAEMEFVDAIRESPQDFPLRVVYADWLEQRGDLEKADLVRLLSVAPREHSPERMRIRDLGARVPNDWLAILSRVPIDGCDQQSTGLCSERWESLVNIDDGPRIRHCNTCGHHVYFCASTDAVIEHSGPFNRVAYSPLLNYDVATGNYDHGMLLDAGQQGRERQALRKRPLGS